MPGGGYLHMHSCTHTNFQDKSNFKKPGMCQPNTWFKKALITTTHRMRLMDYGIGTYLTNQ